MNPEFQPVERLAELRPEYELAPEPMFETAMSVVYAAKDTSLNDRPRAVKFVSDRLAAYRERFDREHAILSRLSHPNIVEVICGTRSGEDLRYIVMPWVETNLTTLVRDSGALGPEATLRIAEQLAAAVDYAHEHGVVHRDIKPGNVLIGKSQHVFLCDFGIAKDVSAEDLTRTGEVLGSPGWMAPERFWRRGDRDGVDETVPVGRRPAVAPLARRVDVYSFGLVLRFCLTGRVPGEEERALPSEVAAVLRRATSPQPMDRYGTCTEVVEALRAALARRQRPAWSDPLRAVARRAGRLRRRSVYWAAGAVAAVGAAAFIVVPQLGTRGVLGPGEAELARLPAALRADCENADSSGGTPGAATVISCAAGADTVHFSLYDDKADMDEAYGDAVAAAGIDRGTGDCAQAVGAEHRYPGVGDPAGRVLCWSGEGTSRLLWSDDEARTLAEVVRRDVDDLGLAEAWSTWVGLPAFPTGDEQALLDLVQLEGCHRPRAADLEDFRNLLAAVECDAPSEDASAIAYFQFADAEGLRHVTESRIAAAEAPEGVYCGDGSAPGFLGYDTLDLRGVDVGTLMCRPGDGFPVIEWTLDAALLMGRITGPDPETLDDAWRLHYGFGPPTAAVVEAVNAAADPPFPTAAEQALLDLVPERSRKDCMRPSQWQIDSNVRNEPQAAVVCGPVRGAGMVFYYQFASAAEMDADYGANNDISGPDCNDEPPDFHGDAPYERDGATGRLGCGTSANGNVWLVWTDERRNVLAMAFNGSSTTMILDWWRYEAGPL
jgi:serine/threonine protein kinase